MGSGWKNIRVKAGWREMSELQCVAVCCSGLQCVAVCCNGRYAHSRRVVGEQSLDR